MPRERPYVKGWFVEIIEGPLPRQFRAELWWNPYGGPLVASTRWVDTKRMAQTDARRVFSKFMPTKKRGR